MIALVAYSKQPTSPPSPSKVVIEYISPSPRRDPPQAEVFSFLDTLIHPRLESLAPLSAIDIRANESSSGGGFLEEE